MLVAVNDHNPDRVQSLARGDWPSPLIVLTAGDPEFTKDNVDIDEILACWERTVRTALDDHGAPFVRLSAEATWWLTQLPSIADLLGSCDSRACSSPSAPTAPGAGPGARSRTARCRTRG